MTHTPGPWRVEEGPNDTRVLDVYAGTWKIHHGAWGRQADAFLIAAAPDLLEACEKAEAGISDWRLGSEHKDHADYRNMTASEGYLCSVLDELRAAIRKATESR